ncbi:hypothetical protein PMZ80_007557 [Knufia obscura]|uniref:Uncharacterized protein n=2 Tax=Knufia TaxID=430999 RepID=A0AAN8ELJ8_9EURO|nr:hypothetical protein PMZ80_007557 [Knufia obscura]KAK5954098.1 hypothetical protein OHC33_004670 [Knufia fluminis]
MPTVEVRVPVIRTSTKRRAIAGSQAPAASGRDYLSVLPLELQTMIYKYLIGSSSGKVSCDKYEQTDAGDSVSATQRSERLKPHTRELSSAFKVKYHLPGSASPSILLVSRRIHDGALPLYQKICFKRIEAPPEVFHCFPDLVPALQYEDVEIAFMNIGSRGSKLRLRFNWEDVPFLHSVDNQAYSNLKHLVLVTDTDKECEDRFPKSVRPFRSFETWYTADGNIIKGEPTGDLKLYVEMRYDGERESREGSGLQVATTKCLRMQVHKWQQWVRTGYLTSIFPLNGKLLTEERRKYEWVDDGSGMKLREQRYEGGLS